MTSISKGQVYSYDDIFKSNKIYFFGYDFTKAKVMESKNIGNDQAFIFGIIQFMNETRKEKDFQKFFKKDSVVFFQNIVNQLNSKMPKDHIIATGIDILNPTISKDSLQEIINKYDTKELSGIGFVQIVETLNKSKKQTKQWFVLFDIRSKKILDLFENSNRDADSWHGYSEYWSVGLRIGMDFYIADHYSKIRKDYNRRNK